MVFGGFFAQLKMARLAIIPKRSLGIIAILSSRREEGSARTKAWSSGPVIYELRVEELYWTEAEIHEILPHKALFICVIISSIIWIDVHLQSVFKL